MKKTGEGVRERFEEAMLLVLKMEVRVMKQGIQSLSRSWESQGSKFFSRASRKEGYSSADILVIAQ